MSASALAEARGELSVPIRAGTGAGSPIVAHQVLYGSSHALVIGIDAYENGWPRLKNAVRDAEAVAAALEERGFQVTLKTNLKSAELRETMREFFILHGEDVDARLFLWYAGHGHTAGGEGFLVPADAPPPTAGGRFRLKALHMRDFSGLVRLAGSKHVLSVFDSCFAGTVFDSRASGAPPAITRATSQPVRQFITAGDADQQVSDDGTFRTLFLRAISGEEDADPNGDGYLTGGELGIFLSDRVTNLTESAQTPRYGKLRDRDYDQGDFVFAIPAALARAAAAAAWSEVKGSKDRVTLEDFIAAHPDSDFAAAARDRLARLAAPSEQAATSRQWSADQALALEGARQQAEVAFWDSVKDSTVPDDFADYLKQFPDGTFAGLAKRRLKQLQANATAALAAPTPELRISPLDEFRVAVKTANIRAAPSTSSERIGRLRTGDLIAVTGLTQIGNARWYRVVLDDGDDGFVFATLLQDEAEWAAQERRRAAEADVSTQQAARDSSENPDGETKKPTGDAAAEAAARLLATEQARVQEDLAHWKTVEAGDDEAALQGYLAKYPDGLFADAARARLSQRQASLRAGAEAERAAAETAESLRLVGRYIADNTADFTEQLTAYNRVHEVALSGHASDAKYRVINLFSTKVLGRTKDLFEVLVSFEVGVAGSFVRDQNTSNKLVLHLRQNGAGYDIVGHEKRS